MTYSREPSALIAVAVDMPSEPAMAGCAGVWTSTVTTDAPEAM